MRVPALLCCIILFVFFPLLSYAGSGVHSIHYSTDGPIPQGSSVSHMTPQQEESFHQLENDAKTLVNFARYDPAKVGKFFNLDVDALFEGIPSHSPLWSSHKWSLRLNSSLMDAANAHVQDMFASDYLSSTSPSGSNHWQRAVEHRYNPYDVHEYISVLVPQNYIHPQTALMEFFSSFFVHEAESFKDGKPSIFDYQVRDMGFYLSSGKLTIKGKYVSVYLMVINYGISKDNLVENSLMQMINTARNDYSYFIEYFDIDRDEAARALDGFLMIHFSGGLLPLVFYSSPEDLHLRIIDQDMHEFAYEFQEEEIISFSARISGETSPHEEALILFNELIVLDEMHGIRAILSARANAGVVNVSRFETEGEAYEIVVDIVIGSVYALPSLFMGTVVCSDSPADVFGPIKACENEVEYIDLFLFNQQDELISSFLIGNEGYFRMTQQKGVNRWEAWIMEEQVASGSYGADWRPLWLDLAIPVSVDNGIQLFSGEN